MTRGNILAFYESGRSGGRSAIVALARIADVTSVILDSIPENLQRGAVVENHEALTSSTRLLATTFDNLLALKQPVRLERLREIGCVTGSNFVTATRLSSAHLKEIIKAGYPNDSVAIFRHPAVH